MEVVPIIHYPFVNENTGPIFHISVIQWNEVIVDAWKTHKHIYEDSYAKLYRQTYRIQGKMVYLIYIV